MKKLRLRAWDIIALIGWCAITVCILFLKYNWLGWNFITMLSL